MIIAAQKKKENIAEYLLYMYQIEDLIRANSFNIQAIEQNIINKFEASYDVKREMLEWYKGLIDRMQSENIKTKGHMAFLNNLCTELNELNLKILHDPLNNEFKDAFDKAKTNIDSLRMRSGHSQENDVQLAMNGLYGYLILKLKQAEISPETKEAFASISEWLALLNLEYLKEKES